jgi:hypothetical protein
MFSTRFVGRRKRIDAWVLSRLGLAVSLTLIGGVLVRSDSTAAVSIPTPETVVSASAKTIPAELPHPRAIPIRLQAGFTSEALSSPTTPELAQIVLEISRGIKFQTAGLPSCPLTDLYSTTVSARQTCAGSLVGHGTVSSEVTLPGQAPAMIKGDLSAFYAFAEGKPRILAQVTSGAPLALIYVIPFQIAKAPHRAFGTSLVVRKMRNIQGECRFSRPNCFAQPYSLKGVYGHISKLELSLHRSFIHAGARKSFLSAQCPASRNRQGAAFPLLQVNLQYTGSFAAEGSRSVTVASRCSSSR